MGRLEGKVALITGAGSGIGRATALRFGAEGARVLANDVDPAAAESVAAQIRGAGGEALAAPGDVTRREAVDALVDLAVTRFGRLDVMHNNAGGAMPAPLLQLSDADYRAQLALNLDAVWFGMTAALRAMVRQRSGSIITTASGAGLGAEPGLGPYGAAKAAVIALTRSVAREYGPLGIRANAICPGPTRTPQFLAWLATVPGGEAGYAAQIPLGRLGAPEDIANAALFLASDESSFVSGAVLAVDGAIAAGLASPRVG
jgi:3-oxoacyl-[acyl-carrier protein] reductase